MFQVDYRYLRPKKAEAMKKQHEAAYACQETPEVWQGKNATILPVRKIDDSGWIGRGGVLDESGHCVEISAEECCVQPWEGTFAQPEYRDEKVVYCGYMIHHWGHFLVEGVTRLWYFLENDASVDKYIFALDEGEIRQIKGNYRRFLELLKIWDKLEFINRPITYREVIVPEMAFRRWGYYSPKYLDIFNTVAENAAPATRTVGNIYMSRSLLPKHKDVEFGFEALDDFFQKNGYTVVYPERVPLDEMIQYIRNADTVATVSGSLPQNMLFGKQGQKLIIAERCAIIDDWQPPVNRIKELRTTYIDANIPIYTVPMTGPFIMGYNDIVRRYAEDNAMVPPDGRFYSRKYFRACFVGYMKSYQDLYRYRWFMEEYLLPEMDYHLEAYAYGEEFYREYLNGSRPFRWHHYLEIHYWKQWLKRVLKKG